MNRFDNKGILRRAQSMGRGLAFIDFKASKSNVDFLFFRKLKVNFIKIVCAEMGITMKEFYNKK